MSAPPQRQQVSDKGSMLFGLTWAPTGRRVYYIGADRAVWAADIATTPGLRVGVPRRLFDAADYGTNLDIAPDGSRFVMVKRESLKTRHELRLVQHALASTGRP